MLINITEQQLNRLVELLKKNAQDKADSYLKNYLEYVQKNEALKPSIELDEIPF